MPTLRAKPSAAARKLALTVVSRPCAVRMRPPLRQTAQLAEENGIPGDDWNGFNVPDQRASGSRAFDMGFVPGEQGRDAVGILEGAASGHCD